MFSRRVNYIHWFGWHKHIHRMCGSDVVRNESQTSSALALGWFCHNTSPKKVTFDLLSASVLPRGIQLKMEEELGAFSSAQHKQSIKMREKRREKKALQLKEVYWETSEAHSSYPKQHGHSGPLSETQTPPHHVLLFKANVFPQAPFYKELSSLSGCSRKKRAVVFYFD